MQRSAQFFTDSSLLIPIGMVQVHAFLICNVFFCDMNIGKVSLKEWILRTEIWANPYMTKMVMKFPPCIEKNFSKIKKIDKRHEKGHTFQTIYRYFYPKFNDQKSFVNRRFINVHAANTKTLQVFTKTGCRWQHLIMGGVGSTIPMEPRVLATCGYQLKTIN